MMEVKVIKINKKPSLKLTPENAERLTLILKYLNSDYYPVGKMSINKSINLTIETFYNLFVESLSDKQIKPFLEQVNLYQRVRDRKESIVMQKLNRLDTEISKNEYLTLILLQNLLLDPIKQTQKVNSRYFSDTMENQINTLLGNQVQQDRNINFNLKNKPRR